MISFPVILETIAPLYFNMLLGFIAGTWLHVPRDSIARLMFYMINPLIIFNGILQTDLDGNVLSLPLLTLIVCSALCIGFYWISGKIWSDNTKNLLAFTAGNGNAGYFGLPLALMLFPDQGEGEYMMALLGMVLYESSLGFYICVRASVTIKDCLKRFLKFPSLYAFLSALILNLCGFAKPPLFAHFMTHIKGAYAVLGMMLIGLGLAAFPKLKIDLKFIGMSCLAKFVAWPAAILLITFIDACWLGIYTPETYQALMLISIVPMAVNTVVMASVLDLQPEKAAMAVFVSTCLALVYVPLFMVYVIVQCPLFPH